MGQRLIGKPVKFGNFKVRYSEHRNKRIEGDSIPLKNYKQQDPHSCGFVAALTVARHFNPDVSDREVLKAVRPLLNWGVNRVKLTKAIRSLGIKADFRKDLTIAKMRKHVKEGSPIIVSVWPAKWETDHWTVVQGFGADLVHLTNHRSMIVENFLKQWSDMDMRSQGGSGEGIVCEYRS
jgi:ABC-type bacteriocin/lantibiotic exporter with double-glycine peptidase domain